MTGYGRGMKVTAAPALNPAQTRFWRLEMKWQARPKRYDHRNCGHFDNRGNMHFGKTHGMFLIILTYSIHMHKA